MCCIADVLAPCGPALHRYNHLDPSINKNSWTEEEDEQLRQAVNIVGTFAAAPFWRSCAPRPTPPRSPLFTGPSLHLHFLLQLAFYSGMVCVLLLLCSWLPCVYAAPPLGQAHDGLRCPSC